MLSVPVILKFTLQQFHYLKSKAEILKEEVLFESLCIKTLKVICWPDEGYCIIDRNTIFFIKTHMATNILLQSHHHNRTIHDKVLDFLFSKCCEIQSPKSMKQ